MHLKNISISILVCAFLASTYHAQEITTGPTLNEQDSKKDEDDKAKKGKAGPVSISVTESTSSSKPDVTESEDDVTKFIFGDASDSMYTDSIHEKLSSSSMPSSKSTSRLPVTTVKEMLTSTSSSKSDHTSDKGASSPTAHSPGENPTNLAKKKTLITTPVATTTSPLTSSTPVATTLTTETSLKSKTEKTTMATSVTTAASSSDQDKTDSAKFLLGTTTTRAVKKTKKERVPAGKKNNTKDKKTAAKKQRKTKQQNDMSPHPLMGIISTTEGTTPEKKSDAGKKTRQRNSNRKKTLNRQAIAGPQGPPGPRGPPGPKGERGPPGNCSCDQSSGPTMRMQAAVTAVLTKHFGPDKDVIVPFDLELIDSADNYDNVSGVFFCSIPGTYVISLYLMSHPGSKVNARVFVNSRPVAALWADDSKDAGFYPSSSIQTISHLEFGDQVYVMLVDGGYGESWVHANYNVFTVFLLYEDMFIMKK